MLDKFVTEFLEEGTFDDLLEIFNITPEEAFWILYNAGMIDEELLEDIKFCDVT